MKEHARNAPARDQRQDAEKIVISTSDFQAALGRDKEKVFRPLYNLQVVQDIESPRCWSWATRCLPRRPTPGP